MCKERRPLLHAATFRPSRAELADYAEQDAKTGGLSAKTLETAEGAIEANDKEVLLPGQGAFYKEALQDLNRTVAYKKRGAKRRASPNGSVPIEFSL